MRVVLFWAPTGWFLKHKVVGKVTPVLITLVLALVLSAIALTLWVPTVVLGAVLLTAAIVVLLVLFIGIMTVVENHPRTVRKVVTFVFAPIWIPLYYLLKLIIYSIDQFFEPYLFRRHKYLALAWVITIIIVNLLIAVLFGVSILKSVWILLGIIAVCVVLAVFVIALLSGLYHLIVFFSKRRKSKVQYDHVESVKTTTLFRKFMDTKTGTKICPFILLPKEEKVDEERETDEE